MEEVEHFLKANHVGIGAGENRSCQAPISQVQGSGLQPAVLRHVVVPGTIKPRMPLGVSEAKVLDVESCDAHGLRWAAPTASDYRDTASDANRKTRLWRLSRTASDMGQQAARQQRSARRGDFRRASV